MLKDLGIALRDGDVTINEDLIITITTDSMQGRPVRYDGDTVEIVYEVFDCMGSFVLPLCKQQFLKRLRDSGLLSFRIVRVMDIVEASNGEQFAPIAVKVCD